MDGGFEGVCVRGNGSLTMTGCEVRSANYGLDLFGNGFLMTTDLILEDCIVSLCLSDSSTANMSGGVIEAYNEGSIHMEANSSLMGSELDIHGGNMEPLFNLRDDARMSLTGGAWGGRPGGVKDRAMLGAVRL